MGLAGTDDRAEIQALKDENQALKDKVQALEAEKSDEAERPDTFGT